MSGAIELAMLIAGVGFMLTLLWRYAWSAVPLIPAAILGAVLMAPANAFAQAQSGMGRVYVVTPGGDSAELVEHLGTTAQYGRVIRETWSFRHVCVAPCGAEVDARRGHVFYLRSLTFPEPGGFRLSWIKGDTTITVAPGHAARLNVGRWLTVLGAASFGFGAMAVPLNYSGAFQEEPRFKAASLGMLIGGAVALAVGIPLMVASRTKLSFTASAPPSRSP